MRASDAVKMLAEMGIRNMADLDAKRDPCAESRYAMLKRLVGTDAADGILHELSIRECCRAPGSASPG